jgi:uncharacterized protein (TIGR03083 family)
MTTPSYSELVTAVRREGEGILAAAGMDLDAAVPTCGDWDLSALVQHVSRIYANVARILSTRATEAPASRPEVPDGEPVAVLSHLLDELVAALSDCDADTPVWTWPDDAPNVALFWARRMAHESSVHRYDAQASHGVVQPIDAELAGDGLDELVDIIAPRVYGRDDVSGPTGSVALQSSDDGAWCIELEPSAVRRLDVLSAPDVTVRGTSSALLLASYRRIPWTSLEVTGDADLLTRWTTAMKV